MNRKIAWCVHWVVILALMFAAVSSACQKETNPQPSGTSVSTQGASLSAETGDVTRSSTTSITLKPTVTEIPTSASEPLHVQYVRYVDQLMKNGDLLVGGGLTVQARFFYSFAGACTSALRFMLEQLLIMKGASLSPMPGVQGSDPAAAQSGTVFEFLQDWDTIAAVNFACPFPSYFESLAWRLKGEQDKADTAFSCARINPYFPREGIDFTYLKDYKATELEALRQEAITLENSIYGTYGGGISPIERNPMNFSDQYLRTLAEESLRQYPENIGRAMTFYATALQVNPFEAKNFTALAILALFEGDLETATDCIHEGLWIDKNNAALNKLAEALQQAERQVP